MTAPQAAFARLNLVLGAALAAGLAGLVAAGAWPGGADPLQVDIGARLAPPSPDHWLGADEFGRDQLARLARGALVSGAIALITVALAAGIGLVLGLTAGFFRGWFDRVLMSVMDALLAFPGILLALALVAVLGASSFGIVLALSLAYIPIVVRVVRASTLSVREREFVEASRLAGDRPVGIIARQVLPNILTPLAVLMTSMFGWVLLSESALSFLGVGVSPPTPTWGNMLSAARAHIDAAPHLAIAPGVCIAATLLATNLLGDALRDILDPRERR